MIKYKIGDRVKLIRDTKSCRNDLKKGDIGIITTIFEVCLLIESKKGKTFINKDGVILQKKKITNWRKEIGD